MNIPLIVIIAGIFLLVVCLDLIPLLRQKPAKAVAVCCSLFLAAAAVPALFYAAGINLADYFRGLGGLPQ